VSSTKTLLYKWIRDILHTYSLKIRKLENLFRLFIYEGNYQLGGESEFLAKNYESRSVRKTVLPMDLVRFVRLHNHAHYIL